jgi:hypothetical protein
MNLDPGTNPSSFGYQLIKEPDDDYNLEPWTADAC